MKIIKKGFYILPENEITYFAHLEGIINSVDELSEAEVVKDLSGYLIRISPSTPEYSQPLLEALLDFHNLLQIKLQLSKSIRNTSTISFKVKKEAPN